MNRSAFSIVCLLIGVILFAIVPRGLSVAAVPQGSSEQAVRPSMDAGTQQPQETQGNPPPPLATARHTTLSNRLLLTGTLLGMLLGQLSVLFGYLKINHATRGFYSGRLQSIAAVASVAVLGAGYLFYTSWMS